MLKSELTRTTAFSTAYFKNANKEASNTPEGVTKTLLRDLHMLKQDGEKPMRLFSSVLNILLSVVSGRYIACATEGIVKQTANNYTKTELSETY